MIWAGLAVVCLSAPALDANEADDILSVVRGATAQGVSLEILPESRDEFCKSWKMSEADVEAWFSRAKVRQPEETHHGYQWAGCYQTGALVTKDGTYLFSINAGGAATVRSDDRVWLFGCQAECADLFDFGLYYTDADVDE